MKRNKLLFSILLFLIPGLFTTCSNKTGMEVNAGYWMFWANQPLYSSSIVVTIYYHGTPYTEFITGYWPTAPDCGTSNCATFPLGNFDISAQQQNGTFEFTAIDSASPTKVNHWQGSFIVTPNNWEHCNTELL